MLSLYTQLEAWDTGAERAVHLFWYFRLQFLSEARFLSKLEELIKNQFSNKFHLAIGKMTVHIDDFRDMKFVDNTHWTKMPYALVKKKEQYDEPSDYFLKEHADDILKAQSLQADLYWANFDNKSAIRGKLVSIATIVRWSMNFAVYVSLIIFGLGTAGWTWPKSFRRHLLAVGLARNPNS